MQTAMRDPETDARKAVEQGNQVPFSVQQWTS
jgi:hypothetical protein